MNFDAFKELLKQSQNWLLWKDVILLQNPAPYNFQIDLGREIILYITATTNPQKPAFVVYHEQSVRTISAEVLPGYIDQLLLLHYFQKEINQEPKILSSLLPIQHES